MAGSTVEITEQSFRSTVDRDGVVLIDWWAPWCGPCRMFGPIFEQVAARHPDLTFGKVNTEVEQNLAAAFEIRSIPTLMVLRDRVLLLSQPGALSAQGLEELIAEVRALDMEKIKAEIEARQKAASSGT
ncbi:MAG TPA: thioredoxin domain-containing protein [Anaeromyxobacteraceae bacterium]|jgi:thioredoxin 1|nr:thioredoxin domain-containing protein [Anaeromyxobacteraceae bacterium]